VAGELYFVANDGTHGYQLWKSDGSAAGTSLVKVLTLAPLTTIARLTNANGRLFFTAAVAAGGPKLWTSDGSAAGTVQVGTVGVVGSLVNVNGTVYFSGSTAAGVALWKSDGTDAGTALVKNINPGSSNLALTNLTDVNGTVFFTVTVAASETQLWKSDGTQAGTVLVKAIDFSGAGGSAYGASDLTNVNGVLYFVADDGVHGRELWKSDGTAAGTVLVQDINPGSGGSTPENLTVVGGNLYFSADDGTHGRELYKLHLRR
jgi:ELWxxDGT repeat protein